MDFFIFFNIAATSNLHIDFFAQQAGGFNNEHHDQDKEHDCVGQLGGNVGLAQVLDDAQQDAAQERARDGADAAENSSHEGLDTGHSAGGGLQGRVGRAEQRTSHRRQRRADGEGQRNGGVDVDAHQLGSAAILGHSLHGVAGGRVVDEPDQRHHDDDAGDDGDDRLSGDGQLTVKQGDRLHAGDNGGEALGVGGPGQLGHLLQKVADADGRDQDSQGRCFTQRAVSDALDRDAEHRADDHRKDDGQHRVHARRAESKEDDIAADHDDIAVGEVQHLGNAVDHGIPQGDQCVNTAQADAVDQVG